MYVNFIKVNDTYFNRLVILYHTFINLLHSRNIDLLRQKCLIRKDKIIAVELYLHFLKIRAFNFYLQMRL
jgi:hypothetical protein